MTGCSSKKIRFDTPEEAHKVIKRAKTSVNKVVPVRYYPCKECKGYHLTSSPGHYGFERPLKLRKAFEKYLNKE